MCLNVVYIHDWLLSTDVSKMVLSDWPFWCLLRKWIHLQYHYRCRLGIRYIFMCRQPLSLGKNWDYPCRHIWYLYHKLPDSIVGRTIRKYAFYFEKKEYIIWYNRYVTQRRSKQGEIRFRTFWVILVLSVCLERIT